MVLAFKCHTPAFSTTIKYYLGTKFLVAIPARNECSQKTKVVHILLESQVLSIIFCCFFWESLFFWKFPSFSLYRYPNIKSPRGKKNPIPGQFLTNFGHWLQKFRAHHKELWWCWEDVLNLEHCIQCFLYNSWPFFFSNAFASTQLCTAAHPFLSWEDWHHLN